ncbi:MAG: sodium/solute symporter [Gemmatimonadota bacterium]
MGALDYAVFAAYLAVVLGVGAHCARHQRGAADYYLAGRSMGWLPIGLSVMVTAFSGINYAAFAGEVSSQGLYVLLSVPLFAAVAVPVIRIIIPFYHALQVANAYQYLERRFGPEVRRLAGGLFLLWRLTWIALVLYVPARMLATVTGLDADTLILLAGAVATLYTLAGGMRAVMWTDVAQFAVLAGGLVLGIAVTAAATPGGLSGVVELAAAQGLTRPFYPFDAQILSPDPRLRISLWSAWIGTGVAFLGRYGADQAVVQRYFTARSPDQARKGFHLNWIAATLALLALALLGLSVHAHAVRAGGGPVGPPIAQFAAFVRDLPAGATGLLVAGLVAATMSSVDSGINSCAAVLSSELWPGADRRDGLGRSRLLSLAIGAVATLAALRAGSLGTLFEVANRVINGLGSPLLALFLLGMFSRRANRRGVLVGGAAGAIASVWVSFAVTEIALHYNAVVNLLVTLVLGYGLSLLENRLWGPPPAAALAWTWAAVRQGAPGASLPGGMPPPGQRPRRANGAL